MRRSASESRNVAEWRAVFGPPAAFHFSSRTRYGRDTDRIRTGNGLHTGLERTGYGQIHGTRTIDGLATGIVLERDACRVGASVFVCCSFCVRSLPVWRSSCVGSCGVRARRQIARWLTGGKPKTADCGSKAQGGGLSSGGSRACDGLLTGGHLSDADNLRHAEMGGGGAADLRRASHGLMTDG